MQNNETHDNRNMDQLLLINADARKSRISVGAVSLNIVCLNVKSN